MSKFTKHLNLGEPIMIDGEQFLLKGLSIEDSLALFKVQRAMLSVYSKDAKMDEVIQKIDDHTYEQIVKIVDKTLELSYPDEPVEERKQFGMKYLWILLPKIFEINSANIPEEHKAKAISKIEELRKRNEKSN